MSNTSKTVLVVKVDQTWERILKEKGRTPCADELYDITRGRWKMNKKRQKRLLYVCASYQGIIQEVYRPLEWHDAEASTNATLGEVLKKDKGRSEFSGEKVSEEIAARYCGKFIKFDRNPIRYIAEIKN